MPKVYLEINEEEIPLNEIMTTVLTNINVGFINALSGIPNEIKEVKINIEI